MTVSAPRSQTALTATVISTAAATGWKEPVGASRNRAFTAPTAAREMAVRFGYSGNSLAGALDGALTLTGSLTGEEAAGALAFTLNPAAGKKVTIGGRVYTYVTAITAANQVLIGATPTASADNLFYAIGAGAGSGTLYGNGTLAHAEVQCLQDGPGLDLFAKVAGSAGNAISTTTDVAGASWSAATLTGGVTACLAEGHAALDHSGAALPALSAVHGVEVTCHAGALLLTLGTKVVALPLPTGGVFHYAGESMATPGSLTLAATAPDTVATVVVIYK